MTRLIPTPNERIEIHSVSDVTDSTLLDYNLQFFSSQFQEPKRSTLHFCDFLGNQPGFNPSDMVLDIGAGMGAILHTMTQRWPAMKVTGIEKRKDLVDKGRQILNDLNSPVILNQADLFALDETYRGRFDGITCVCTLLALPGIRRSLKAMLALQPRWLAMSSLFYDGPVTCEIRIKKYFHKPLVPKNTSTYTVYSLPRLKEFLAENGYDLVSADAFEIDVDLPQPPSGMMGTYTERLADGRRLQVSGPMLMPWYFIFVTKTGSGCNSEVRQ